MKVVSCRVSGVHTFLEKDVHVNLGIISYLGVSKPGQIQINCSFPNLDEQTL